MTRGRVKILKYLRSFSGKKLQKTETSDDKLRNSLIPADEYQSPAHALPVITCAASAAAPAVSSGAGESRLCLQPQPKSRAQRRELGAEGGRRGSGTPSDGVWCARDKLHWWTVREEEQSEKEE